MILAIGLGLIPAMALAQVSSNLHPAAEGCFKVLSSEYEDGASYYTSIGRLIIQPLKTDSKNLALAEFLSDALVVTGHMNLTEEICESLSRSTN